jgi:hypothetical protein
MLDRTFSLVALAVLAAFLGILLWKVPRLDLAAVIGATFLLVAYDFLVFSRRKS